MPPGDERLDAELKDWNPRHGRGRSRALSSALHPSRPYITNRAHPFDLYAKMSFPFPGLCASRLKLAIDSVIRIREGSQHLPECSTLGGQAHALLKAAQGSTCGRDAGWSPALPCLAGHIPMLPLPILEQHPALVNVAHDAAVEVFRSTATGAPALRFLVSPALHP